MCANTSPSSIVDLANSIGRRRGIFCKYKEEKGRFRYVYYRKHAFGISRIGATDDGSKVVAKMEKYCTTI